MENGKDRNLSPEHAALRERLRQIHQAGQDIMEQVTGEAEERLRSRSSGLPTGEDPAARYREAIRRNIKGRSSQ